MRIARIERTERGLERRVAAGGGGVGGGAGAAGGRVWGPGKGGGEDKGDVGVPRWRERSLGDLWIFQKLGMQPRP